MKIKNLIFSVFLSVILLGLIGIGFISVMKNKEASIKIDQNQIHIPNSYKAASISKGTIFLLLAVGVIGVLGISRKKKEIGSSQQRGETSIGPGHQNMNQDNRKIKT